MKNTRLPKTLPKFFWHFVKQYWLWFLGLQILTLAWALDNSVMPYIIGWLIDSIVNFVGDKATIWRALAWPLIAGASLWVLTDAMWRLSGFGFGYIMPKVEAAIRMAMFEYVQQHSYRYFADNLAGRMANKISDMTQNVVNILRSILEFYVPAVITIVFIITLFSVLQPLFGAIILSWVIIHFAVSFGFAGKCHRLSNVHAEANSLLSGKVVDNLTNFVNVKLFARRRFEQAYLNHYQQDELNKNQRSLWQLEKIRILYGAITFLGPGVLLTWAILLSWQRDAITVGDVVFILVAAGNIINIVWYLSMELPNLFRELGTCQQALSIIQDPHEITDQPNAKPLTVVDGEIVFDKVNFHYQPEVNLFKDKSLVIQAKQRVGLVGFSGAGKSTFVNLIARFFDIESGKILIDNQNIAEVTQDSLREHVAIIPQDPVLFHRSLMENIRYGKPEASDEEVYVAAKKAFCHEFIVNFPHGYSTLVGERGIKLSGGQRQRIAIARAVLKDAPILILDEATSALDSDTEKKIQDALTQLMQNRTTIIIAHRLSTLRQVDRILVFKTGQVVEDGTHEALLAQPSHYAYLWSMQADGFIPEKAG